MMLVNHSKLRFYIHECLNKNLNLGKKIFTKHVFSKFELKFLRSESLVYFIKLMNYDKVSLLKNLSKNFVPFLNILVFKKFSHKLKLHKFKLKKTYDVSKKNYDTV